ncbi:PaaI family thioesterase [Nocardioides sp.]|uniref:PaaI family thioesterase n=1 Tax=Nocardioides sp. TaxID=35761 RepID=UPI001A2828FE|nr:PaaI family thioesterase [Nocardioides sp.]MBJ7356178.1 PaaI family thioesterase [Nocardioides sp.]
MTQTQREPDLSQWRTETREVTWALPGQGDFEALSKLDGLGQLQSIEQGLMPPPPVMSTIGMTHFHAERGTVTCGMRAETFHYNPLGGVHGGMISTLLDTAAGCSVHSTLAVGEGYTSLDLSVKFLRPVTVDSGLLACVGKVVSRGRRTALAEAQLFDENDRLLAHATSSCMIFGG